MLGGIAAGVLTTQLYLPYLPIATLTMPPFLVVTPWGSHRGLRPGAARPLPADPRHLLTLVLRLQLGRVLRLGDA